ncbi:MAG TPA: two-component regulator propeller domain-containing protein [Rubricoccaceae bacterium]|jgi:ligand-binding sensor domain-containing protein/signal transduction histidine kinase
MAAALAVGLVAAASLWAAAQPATAPGTAGPAAARDGSDAVAFRHLTREQGLPSQAVYAVAQDALGFVWIGTADGLARYDGLDVRVFRHRADSSSVVGNEILALAAGAGGEMWIGTSDGLSRYDPAREAFETVAGLPDDNVLAVAVDTAGVVWAGTDGGLARVVRRAGEPDESDEAGTVSPFDVTVYETRAGTATALPDAVVQAVLPDAARGVVWVGTGDGLARLDPTTGRFRTFRPEGATAADVSALGLSERGSVLVGTAGDGLFALDPRSGRFTPVDVGPGLNARLVLAVHEDTGGTVWVGTLGGGLRRLTPGAGVTLYEADPNDPAAIADNQVAALFEDRQGILWAGTYAGLDRFDRSSGTAVRLRHATDDPASLASTTVRSVLATRDGTLYVGTDRTLDRSVDGRTFTHTEIGVEGGLGAHAVSALYQDRAGAVWVGTEGAGFYQIASGGALDKAPVEGEIGNLTTVQAFFEDRAGQFWVGTLSDGLLLYDRAAKTARRFRARAGQRGALISDNVRALTQTADGTLWIATADGLCRLESAAGAGAFACPGRGTGAAAGDSALVGDDLYALHASTDGSLWAGGRNGLVHVDESGAVRRYTAADNGLAGETVFAILPGDRDYLWLSTSGGLNQIEPTSGVASSRLGVGGADRTLGTPAARAPDGRLFVGGADGLLAFYPRQVVTRNSNPPQVVITGVDVLGQAVVPGPESALDAAAPVAHTLRLSYDDEYVTLRFAGLHFADPARNTYRFRLEGFDDAWRDAGTAREATYTNLDPGRYTFRVQAANPDGVWSEPGAAIAVTVRPPWWRTVWATLAFIGLAGVALVRGERWQKTRLLRQERERAERREAELRAETAEADAERQRAETAALQAENRRAAAEVERAREVHEANDKLEAANSRLETSLGELRATQTQLVQSEKLASLGQLTAGIAHEIKNPLNFVNNFADLSVDLAADLRQDLEAAGDRPVAEVLPTITDLLDDLQDNARRIREHGQRADRIVRAMLLHSRGGAVERARVDVNRFVEEYANLAYHGARANDADLVVDVRRDFDDAAGEAEVVPQELGRVLINLLSNAFHAVGERKRAGEADYAPAVTLHTRREPAAGAAGGAGDTVEIALADNGPGIPEAVLEKIFEPFFTTKPAGEGTGLGLSLAYDIVTQVHGGTMAVESAVGTGTTFTIRIPASAPPVAVG